MAGSRLQISAGRIGSRPLRGPGMIFYFAPALFAPSFCRSDPESNQSPRRFISKLIFFPFPFAAAAGGLFQKSFFLLLWPLQLKKNASSRHIPAFNYFKQQCEKGKRRKTSSYTECGLSFIEPQRMLKYGVRSSHWISNLPCAIVIRLSLIPCFYSEKKERRRRRYFC